MSNKEILDLNIMGKNISIACPPKDKEGLIQAAEILNNQIESCLLYTSPSPRDEVLSRMPSSA